MAPAKHFLHRVLGLRGARTPLPPATAQLFTLLLLSNALSTCQPPLQTEFRLAPNPTSGMQE